MHGPGSAGSACSRETRMIIVVRDGAALAVRRPMCARTRDRYRLAGFRPAALTVTGNVKLTH